MALSIKKGRSRGRRPGKHITKQTKGPFYCGVCGHKVDKWADECPTCCSLFEDEYDVKDDAVGEKLRKKYDEEHRKEIPMRIAKVTSDDTTVNIELRADENEFSKLTIVVVSIENGSLRIQSDVGDKKGVMLVNGGKVEKHPYSHSKMNSIESELENALRLLREVKNEDE